MDALRELPAEAALNKLCSLKRSELQKLAKECGLKANVKSVDLVASLHSLLVAESSGTPPVTTAADEREKMLLLANEKQGEAKRGAEGASIRDLSHFASTSESGESLAREDDIAAPIDTASACASMADVLGTADGQISQSHANVLEDSIGNQMPDPRAQQTVVATQDSNVTACMPYDLNGQESSNQPASAPNQIVAGSPIPSAANSPSITQVHADLGVWSPDDAENKENNPGSQEAALPITGSHSPVLIQAQTSRQAQPQEEVSSYPERHSEPPDQERMVEPSQQQRQQQPATSLTGAASHTILPQPASFLARHTPEKDQIERTVPATPQSKVKQPSQETSALLVTPEAQLADGPSLANCSPGLLAEARKIATQVRTGGRRLGLHNRGAAVEAPTPSSHIRHQPLYTPQRTPSRLSLMTSALSNRLRLLMTPTSSGKQSSDAISDDASLANATPGGAQPDVSCSRQSNSDTSLCSGAQPSSDSSHDVRGQHGTGMPIPTTAGYAAADSAACAANDNSCTRVNSASPAISLIASSGGTPGGAEAALSAAMMSSLAVPATPGAPLSPGMLTMPHQARAGSPAAAQQASEDEAAAAYVHGVDGNDSLASTRSSDSSCWRGATEAQLREMERGWDAYKAGSPGWVAPSPAAVRAKAVALSAAGFAAMSSPLQRPFIRRSAQPPKTPFMRKPLSQRQPNVVAGCTPRPKEPSAKTPMTSALLSSRGAVTPAKTPGRTFRPTSALTRPSPGASKAAALRASGPTDRARLAEEAFAARRAVATQRNTKR